MKLTDKDIAAIEAFLTHHQSGLTGREIAAKYHLTIKTAASWPSQVTASLRKIGVDIPSMRKMNGFNSINATELAEFRQWKLDRSQRAAE